MENNFDYYLIESKSDETYPLIRIKGRDNRQAPTLMDIEFNDPVPRKPVMADYLEGSESFFNKKLADVIIGLKLDYIKLIETQWIGKQKGIAEKYYCLDVDNEIEAMDKEKSEFEYEYRVYSIYKFVLDRAALEKIPLEKRLIFVLGEALSRVVFHKSVVDLIMAENPTGVQFKPIENWEF